MIFYANRGPSRVLAFLAEHPGQGFTTDELAAALGICVKRVREAVTRLYGEGHLLRDTGYGGRYFLPGLPVESTWPVLERRPLVASLGVYVQPAFQSQAAA